MKRPVIVFCIFLLAVPVIISFGCEKKQSLEELNKELLVESIEGNTAGIQKLIDKGADLNTRDGDGKAPLHLAVENDQIMTELLLINLGADVNARDSRGWTPLHLAAFSNSTKAAKLLLDNEADVNARDNIGWTPLDISADLSYTEMSKLLLERGGFTRYTE